MALKVAAGVRPAVGDVEIFHAPAGAADGECLLGRGGEGAAAVSGLAP
jgi:hypothetical protein